MSSNEAQQVAITNDSREVQTPSPGLHQQEPILNEVDPATDLATMNWGDVPTTSPPTEEVFIDQTSILAIAASPVLEGIEMETDDYHGTNSEKRRLRTISDNWSDAVNGLDEILSMASAWPKNPDDFEPRNSSNFSQKNRFEDDYRVGLMSHILTEGLSYPTRAHKHLILLEENLRFVSNTSWENVKNDITLLTRVIKEDEWVRALAFSSIASHWKTIVRKESSNTPFSCGDIRETNLEGFCHIRYTQDVYS